MDSSGPPMIGVDGIGLPADCEEPGALTSCVYRLRDGRVSLPDPAGPTSVGCRFRWKA